MPVRLCSLAVITVTHNVQCLAAPFVLRLRRRIRGRWPFLAPTTPTRTSPPPTWPSRSRALAVMARLVGLALGVQRIHAVARARVSRCYPGSARQEWFSRRFAAEALRRRALDALCATIGEEHPSTLAVANHWANSTWLRIQATLLPLSPPPAALHAAPTAWGLWRSLSCL